MGRIFGIFALIIYFIWGQGFACVWWIWIIFGVLVYSILTNTASILQWILGLFLIGIIWFAATTFGYNEDQRKEFKAT